MSFAVASTASLRAPVAVRGDAASARRRTRVTVRTTVNTSLAHPSRDVEPTRSSMHIDAQLCPQHPSTLTPLSSHHLRYPSTQASLSPSHPVERASIVKTVVDRIAGASLAIIAATVAIATSPASAIQMGLPEEEVTKLICDAACETTINDAELVTTQSGLQYRDIKVGDGVQPEVGFQGKFILILIWAIGLTSCFVYSRRRLHREKRARTGEFLFISGIRAIGMTPCLCNVNRSSTTPWKRESRTIFASPDSDRAATRTSSPGWTRASSRCDPEVSGGSTSRESSRSQKVWRRRR